MSKETDVTENRRRGIGGSDIAAIMGDSPFTTRWELLQYKVGIKENDFQGNEYTRFGQMIEPKIRAYLNDICKAHFEPDYIEENADEPISYFYHSDGCDDKIETLIEIKSSSRIANDLLPKAELIEFYKGYLEQLAYGMWLHGFQKGILAVYERPDDMSETFDAWGLHIYRFTAEELRPLMDKIIPALIDFRADWGWLKEHRDIDESELPSRYQITAVIDDSVTIGDDKISAAWLLQNEKSITDALKRIKTSLKEQMEQHDISSVTFGGLGIRATYVPQGQDKTVQKFDEKAFEKDNPSLYKKYLKDTVQKGKASYVRLTVQKQEG